MIGAIEVDGRPVGDGRPGEVTRRLKSAFETYARTGELPGGGAAGGGS